MSEPRSFAAQVIADDTGNWASNMLRFATWAEAARYADDLAMRWTLVQDTRVIETIEPVNCHYADGKVSEHFN